MFYAVAGTKLCIGCDPENDTFFADHEALQRIAVAAGIKLAKPKAVADRVVELLSRPTIESIDMDVTEPK
jgi:hypothetical protein